MRVRAGGLHSLASRCFGAASYAPAAARALTAPWQLLQPLIPLLLAAAQRRQHPRAPMHVPAAAAAPRCTRPRCSLTEAGRILCQRLAQRPRQLLLGAARVGELAGEDAVVDVSGVLGASSSAGGGRSSLLGALLLARARPQQHRPHRSRQPLPRRRAGRHAATLLRRSRGLHPTLLLAAQQHACCLRRCALRLEHCTTPAIDAPGRRQLSRGRHHSALRAAAVWRACASAWTGDAGCDETVLTNGVELSSAGWRIWQGGAGSVGASDAAGAGARRMQNARAA